MKAKDRLGRRGEDLAAAYLTGCGFAILDRNWRCRLGELDIVARDGGALAAVEVKTRSGTGYGHPFEAVTEAKLHRLLLLGRAWARERGLAPELVRIDVIGIIDDGSGAPVLEHLRAVA